MLKKGFNLFTTSPSAIGERKRRSEEPKCCEVCTSPFFNLCKPFCKYRKATLMEFIHEFLEERRKEKGHDSR